jgi:hypothetical protein
LDQQIEAFAFGVDHALQPLALAAEPDSHFVEMPAALDRPVDTSHLTWSNRNYLGDKQT